MREIQAKLSLEDGKYIRDLVEAMENRIEDLEYDARRAEQQPEAKHG